MKSTLKKKILLSFSAVLFLIAILSGVTYQYFSLIDVSYTEAIEERLSKITLANDMIDNSKEKQIAIKGFLLTGEGEHLSEYNTRVENSKNLSEEFLNMKMDTKGKELLLSYISHDNQYEEIANQIIKMKQNDTTADITGYMNKEEEPVVNALYETAEKLLSYQEELLFTKSDQLSITVGNTQKTILAISVLALLIGIIIALLISKNISDPVKKITRSADQIANGNLVIEEIDIKNKDEIGLLASSFNIMARNLKELIHQTSMTSEQVAASAEQLTASAEQTNSAAIQVASAIETVAGGSENLSISTKDTSLTIKEMTKGIQQVAETTANVAELALESIQQAVLGTEQLDKVTVQMNSIQSSSSSTNDVVSGLNKRSQQIDEIIDVITGIAEQTNLLALNAAIESARAGEHGKGFAVVANEVKQLAEQSRISASQISELIKGIQTDTHKVVTFMDKEMTEVTHGIKLVEETGKSFNSILHSIENVSSEVQQVAAISQEMSASVEQVNHNIEGVATVVHSTGISISEIASATEEQSASMEEVTASAGSLADIAEELRELVGKFKV